MPPPEPAASPSFEFSPHAAPAADPQSPCLLPPHREAQAAPAPASPSSLRASLSPGDARAAKAAGRRAAAAQWLADRTGVQVPHDSDFVFRQALRDGVALCRLLNALRPGAVPRVIDHSAQCSSPTGDVIQTFENVANFIKVGSGAQRTAAGGAATGGPCPFGSLTITALCLEQAPRASPPTRLHPSAACHPRRPPRS